MLGHLKTLLEAMPAGLERPVGELPLLTAPEQTQILSELNGVAGVPPTRRISDLVVDQVGRTPDAPAAGWEERDGTSHPQTRSLATPS